MYESVKQRESFSRSGGPGFRSGSWLQTNLGQKSRRMNEEQFFFSRPGYSGPSFGGPGQGAFGFSCCRKWLAMVGS